MQAISLIMLVTCENNDKKVHGHEGVDQPLTYCILPYVFFPDIYVSPKSPSYICFAVQFFF